MEWDNVAAIPVEVLNTGGANKLRKVEEIEFEMRKRRAWR